MHNSTTELTDFFEDAIPDKTLAREALIKFVNIFAGSYVYVPTAFRKIIKNKAIADELKAGAKPSSLAIKYGVSVVHVYDIMHGRAQTDLIDTKKNNKQEKLNLN